MTARLRRHKTVNNLDAEKIGRFGTIPTRQQLLTYSKGMLTDFQEQKLEEIDMKMKDRYRSQWVSNRT